MEWKKHLYLAGITALLVAVLEIIYNVIFFSFKWAFLLSFLITFVLAFFVILLYSFGVKKIEKFSTKKTITIDIGISLVFGIILGAVQSIAFDPHMFLAFIGILLFRALTMFVALTITRFILK
jgi:hypothetical protein